MRETTLSGSVCSNSSATAFANAFVCAKSTSSTFSGTYTCSPLEPEVFTKLARPRFSNRPLQLERQARAVEHVGAGSPGSRSKTIEVGRSGEEARASGVCSSIAARLASHTSVGRSSASV